MYRRKIINRKKKKKKIKLQAEVCMLIKKQTFAKVLKTSFLQNIYGRLFLQSFHLSFHWNYIVQLYIFFTILFVTFYENVSDINWLFIFLKALTIKIFFPHILNCISRRSDLSFVQNGFAKAAVRRCFLKKVFLKTWQCLHENTCGRVLF